MARMLPTPFITPPAADMKIYPKVIHLLGLLLLSAACHAQTIEVSAARYPVRTSQYILELDVSASPKHRVFVLETPACLIIDIKNAKLKQPLSPPPASHPLFSTVQAEPKNTSDLRIIVGLKKNVDAKHFSLSSNNRDAHQLRIDLRELLSQTIINASTTVKNPVPEARAQKQAKPIAAAKPPTPHEVVSQAPRAIIIAIDAGHGGSDPGARGPLGTEEKTVTFSIANKLGQLINASGMKAVMVRKNDELIGLRERTKIARAANADLFVSIHADAYHDATIRGASVYTLSKSGASSEAARWLANNENAADAKLGGVGLDDKEDDVASVLMDLSQSASQQASVEIANNILKSFHEVCGLHRTEVQNAGFMVLKAPDMPSILVETAFISNPEEEKNLLSNSYQNKMAQAIFAGIRDYFKSNKDRGNNVATLGK